MPNSFISKNCHNLTISIPFFTGTKRNSISNNKIRQAQIQSISTTNNRNINHQIQQEPIHPITKTNSPRTINNPTPTDRKSNTQQITPKATNPNQTNKNINSTSPAARQRIGFKRNNRFHS
jgi:hypothetical protein